jgi:hypothetical protein
MTFYATPGEGVFVNQYIDLSQCASIVNRRFYRQGLNWVVGGISVFTDGGTGTVSVSKIPDTWVASNAWMKGFATWQKMNNEALDEAESVKAKFTDFKVFMDAPHLALGSAANLLPVDSNGVPYAAGEWDYSRIAQPRSDVPGAATDREIIWTGANYPVAAGGSSASGFDAVSLIEGYAASRALPYSEDPNTPADALDASGSTPENWQSALFNEGTSQTEDVLDFLLVQNDQAPYPFEGDGVNLDTMYPGGANQASGPETHDVVLVTSTTVGGKTSIPGTNFPGGLIKISNNISSGNMTVLVHLVPGHHRGYMCQPMQDV